MSVLTREPVRHGLEVDAGGGHALGVRHEAVSEVTPVREVLTHDPVMGGEQACRHHTSCGHYHHHHPPDLCTRQSWPGTRCRAGHWLPTGRGPGHTPPGPGPDTAAPPCPLPQCPHSTWVWCIMYDDWHVRLISPLSRITLAVFVVKTGAQHCQRGPAAEVLTGYQLQPGHLEHERVERSLWRDNRTWIIWQAFSIDSTLSSWWCS